MSEYYTVKHDKHNEKGYQIRNQNNRPVSIKKIEGILQGGGGMLVKNNRELTLWGGNISPNIRDLEGNVYSAKINPGTNISGLSNGIRNNLLAGGALKLPESVKNRSSKITISKDPKNWTYSEWEKHQRTAPIEKSNILREAGFKYTETRVEQQEDIFNLLKKNNILEKINNNDIIGAAKIIHKIQKKNKDDFYKEQVEFVAQNKFGISSDVWDKITDELSKKSKEQKKSSSEEGFGESFKKKVKGKTTRTKSKKKKKPRKRGVSTARRVSFKPTPTSSPKKASTSSPKKASTSRSKKEGIVKKGVEQLSKIFRRGKK